MSGAERDEALMLGRRWIDNARKGLDNAARDADTLIRKRYEDLARAEAFVAAVKRQAAAI